MYPNKTISTLPMEPFTPGTIEFTRKEEKPVIRVPYCAKNAIKELKRGDRVTLRNLTFHEVLAIVRKYQRGYIVSEDCGFKLFALRNNLVKISPWACGSIGLSSYTKVDGQNRRYYILHCSIPEQSGSFSITVEKTNWKLFPEKLPRLH